MAAQSDRQPSDRQSSDRQPSDRQSSDRRPSDRQPSDRQPNAQRAASPTLASQSLRDGQTAAWLLGVSSVALLGLVLVLGITTPAPDYVQGEASRLIYVHPATAWVAYAAFATTTVCGLLYLWPRTRKIGWDHAAGAAAHIGVFYVALTFVLGAIWGRGTWGTFFRLKDARMASTLVLLLMYLGVVTLRQLPAAPSVRARRTALGALLAFPVVPIVHFSVKWWDTLHQQPTLAQAQRPPIEGLPLTVMLLSIAAFTVFFAWLMVHRIRIERWKDELLGEDLDVAIAARQQEGRTAAQVTV
jgi:heme exporter protein C